MIKDKAKNAPFVILAPIWLLRLSPVRVNLLVKYYFQSLRKAI